MFDTINRTEVAPQYPQTVHHHRAPTDKSIELYNEMIERARSQVVEEASLTGNILGDILVFKQPYTIICNFVLNDHTYRIQLDKRELAFIKSPKDVQEVLTRKISSILALEIIKRREGTALTETFHSS